MKFAGFDFDAVRGQLRFQGDPVPLQEQLLKLLSLFLTRPGEVVSRERIRVALWGNSQGDHDHRINTAIRKLRKRLEEYAGTDELSIVTSAGEGYRLLLPKNRTLKEVALDAAGYDAFLNGRFLFSQRNPSALVAARQNFELACERNPEFALAHASLSRTCRFLTIFEMAEPRPLWDQAEKHAHLAVQLDQKWSARLEMCQWVRENWTRRAYGTRQEVPA